MYPRTASGPPSLNAHWQKHSVHGDASYHVPVQHLGREKFHTEYHLQVCELMRESKFVRGAKKNMADV
jgi:hypothetical protein